MNIDEAIAEAERWLRHLRQQEERSRKMQQLATLAREGPDGHAKAQRELKRLDKRNTVYDGARLSEAVVSLIGYAKLRTKHASGAS